MLHMCVCVVCVRAACACACVCESNMALKCRCGIISQSAKRCYQDFLGGGRPKFLLSLIKNKYANGKWKMASGKRQMGGSKVKPHYSI